MKPCCLFLFFVCLFFVFLLRLDISFEAQAEQNGGTATDVLPEVISMPSRFETVQQKGNIDVWWLYDDGGTLLTEHVLGLGLESSSML